MRFIEVNYHYHREFTNPEEAIRLHMPSNMFVHELKEEADVTLIKHINFEGQVSIDGIEYAFFKGKNKFFHIPANTHRFIQEANPDMVLVQGLIFPFQVITLRRRLGQDCKIVLQHQGEVPYEKKRMFQRMADRSVDGYIFTSMGNAKEWIDVGVIRDPKKCFEINPSTTTFRRRDKAAARSLLGLNGERNFLWVGRLNENKDPVTVLKGFERYLQERPSHQLYMIYSDEQDLDSIEAMLEGNAYLKHSVHLVGRVPQTELENWYNAADYLVSGSHREGGSYALTEAMACGCIPIVTEIPSAMKAIGGGKAGYHYRAGSVDELYTVLRKLTVSEEDRMSVAVERQFIEEMSARAIAEKMLDVYRQLSLSPVTADSK